jgi:serpin B
MLGEGAEGETAAQISRVLGFGDAGRQQVNEFSRNMMVIADNSSEAVVRIANAIVLNKGYTLKDSFIKAVREYYDAKAVTMDFADPATLRYINGWASEKTNGLIPELLKEVDPGAFSYLMDALYFKGAWTDEFQQWKQDADFFKEDGSTSKVNMINSLIKEYPYCKTPVAQAVALDYKGGNYRMTLVLPSEGNKVSDVLSALGEGLWKDISSALSGTPAIVYMPSFETASDVPLKDILKSMGMTAAFGAADFSRMTDSGVAVDDIFQKAKIKVDRYGTEAAAVTVAVVKETAFPIMDEPLKIVADHPFIYLITERTTGALLFVGVFAG